MTNIHVGDIGTRLVLNLLDDGLPLDLTGATITLRLNYPATPARISFDRTADIAGDPLLGIAEYFSVVGDFGVSGGWKAQATVENPEGEWHSDWFEFDVDKNLSDPPV
jgi:hypothetical protein